MRCRTCNYPLWELRSRVCPECGAGFAPSEFSFVPESVRFNCPHCAQTYYGTTPEGHLEPAAFACVRCGSSVHMDEMVLLPAAGVVEEQTRAVVVPWAEREAGFFARWFGTIWMVLFSPMKLIRTLNNRGTAGDAVAFGVLTNGLYYLLGLGIFAIPMGLGFAVAGGGGRVIGLVMAILFLIGIPLVLSLAMIVLWSLATHAILRVSGPTDGPLGRTFTAVAYASAANVLAAIPCIGFYMLPVSWIWWGVNAALMIRINQRVSGLRAAAAVFAPALLLVVAGVVWVVTWFMGVQTQITVAQANNRAMVLQTAGGAQTEAMLQALLSYAADHAGAGPPHAAALAADAGLVSRDFYIGAPPTLVGGVHWIDALAASPEAERRIAIDAAAASVPEGAVAHRVGEFVFTYHGIDLGPGSGADGGLWVVVGIPPPGMTSFSYPVVPVGRADGTIETIAINLLLAALAAQNALRAQAGLAPLPDPRTVVEGAPVTAESGD